MWRFMWIFNVWMNHQRAESAMIKAQVSWESSSVIALPGHLLKAWTCLRRCSNRPPVRKGWRKHWNLPKVLALEMVKWWSWIFAANIANLARLKNKSGREFQKIMWLLRVLQWDLDSTRVWVSLHLSLHRQWCKKNGKLLQGRYSPQNQWLFLVPLKRGR